MVTIDQEALERLCREQGVKRLRLFGSAARGEERADSDVDLLVEFESPPGFFGLLELENRFALLFDRPVDLVTEKGLSPHLRDSILSRTSVLYDAAE